MAAWQRVCAHPVLLIHLLNVLLVRAGTSGDDEIEIAGVKIYNYNYNSFNPEAVGVSADPQMLESQPRDWMLMLKAGVTQQQLDSFCMFVTGCETRGHIGAIPFIKLLGTRSQLTQVCQSHADELMFVEPEFLLQVIPEVPEATHETSASSSSSWGLDRVGVPVSTNKGSGVHIYILDTGIRTSHNDFAGRAVPTLDMTVNPLQECKGSTSCAQDRHGHGTHCAGTAGGTTYGVAPQSTLHAVKVLGDDGYGSMAWSVGAIDWVVSKGQRPAVISMSLGAAGNSRADQVAINAATNAGVTVVVAAGNENSDACNYSPAFVSSAITVGSTTIRDARSSFSNKGRCVDIYAPGSNIVSASHRGNSNSRTMSGTSMACPHVAGAAALVLESNPSTTPDQVVSSLVAQAKSGLITGLTSADPNKLLYVGSSLTPAPGPSVSCAHCYYRDAAGVATTPGGCVPYSEDRTKCVNPAVSHWCSSKRGSYADVQDRCSSQSAGTPAPGQTPSPTPGQTPSPTPGPSLPPPTAPPLTELRTSDGFACFKQEGLSVVESYIGLMPWTSRAEVVDKFTTQQWLDFGPTQSNVQMCNSSCKAVDNDVGQPCIFPFTFKGTAYNGCTTVDDANGVLWCSTLTDADGVHVGGQGKWGHCSSSCPVDQGAQDIDTTTRPSMFVNGAFRAVQSIVTASLICLTMCCSMV